MTVQTKINDNSSQFAPTQDWTFSSKDTLISTHAVHPYVASMNPHLARTLIRKVSPENKIILDPFVGGGTVLVEALRNGTPGQGIDVNPLAVLISKVKTTYIPKSDLKSSLHDIMERYSNISVNPFDFPKYSRIDYWFKPESIDELSKLSTIINTLEDQDLKDFFQVVLSAAARDVSLTYRGEVRLRRLQGKDLEKFKPNAVNKFIERAELAINRVSALPHERRIHVCNSNVMDMPFDNDQFSAIVCSPPYGDDRNGVGYFQFSKNMLFWLGYSSDEIRQHKQMFLGEIKQNKVPPTSESLYQAIEAIKRNPVPSNPKAVQECVAFYHDYQMALKEMVRVCSGKIAIVIGNRILSKTPIDNAQITTELMENLDCKLVEYYSRTIDKKRIGVMKANGGSRNTSGGGLINIEHTLIYEQK